MADAEELRAAINTIKRVFQKSKRLLSALMANAESYTSVIVETLTPGGLKPCTDQQGYASVSSATHLTCRSR
jgi:hypothetical protein